MALPNRAELPAPLGNSKLQDPSHEDDPFADTHRITSEESSLYERSLRSNYGSDSRPAELPGLDQPHNNPQFTTRQEASSTSSQQRGSRSTPPPPNTTQPTHSATQASNRRQRQKGTSLLSNLRSKPAPFADPRPVRERLPSEYYSPPAMPRTHRDLPKATDVNGRYILKTAVSRTALQLAGIDFTEHTDHVMLHSDPGPIGLVICAPLRVQCRTRQIGGGKKNLMRRPIHMHRKQSAPPKRTWKDAKCSGEHWSRRGGGGQGTQRDQALQVHLARRQQEVHHVGDKICRATRTARTNGL